MVNEKAQRERMRFYLNGIISKSQDLGAELADMPHDSYESVIRNLGTPDEYVQHFEDGSVISFVRKDGTLYEIHVKRKK